MAHKTYTLLRPVETHFQAVSCETANCEHHRNGWATYADESTPDGLAQANYIRLMSGRRFVEQRGAMVPSIDGAATFTLVITDDGPLTVFSFEAGQTCFVDHRDLIEDKEPFVIVREGTHDDPGPVIRHHTKVDDWVDDFATHQQKIAEAVARG